jgi:hypothetical protein
MSLYNLVTDNFKEYDFDTEYCLYFVCESRDMSDESGNRYTYSMNGIIDS